MIPRVSPRREGKMKQFVQPTIAWLASMVSMATIQWLCIQFLARYCAVWSILGPIYNIVSLGSPICHAVNTFQLEISSHFMSMWSIVVPIIVSIIVKNNKN